MAYSKIRLIGGPSDGVIYDAWAGEGVFPVRHLETSAAAFARVNNEPHTVPNQITNYEVHVIVWDGHQFFFAIPVNTHPVHAMEKLFPGGDFAGARHVHS